MPHMVNYELEILDRNKNPISKMYYLLKGCLVCGSFAYG